MMEFFGWKDAFEFYVVTGVTQRMTSPSCGQLSRQNGYADRTCAHKMMWIEMTTDYLNCHTEVDLEKIVIN